MLFSEPLIERLNTIISTSETKQSSLIPLLREIQNEFGHLSNESMEEAAKMLEISPSSVQNVATFYTMFFTEPVGKHVVWVCRTLSCALRGAEHVEHYMCDKLGIKTGETTPDGKITLMEAECLASCGTAPVMLVDDTLEENLTKESVDKVIEELNKD
ncbi:MAG: NADH-quinone oxidoreductase subunit NuoE [Thermodesulfobacteriota bacterium]|jgi:NADH-quinone oxidoreductase subunit E|nr:NADH-quinone oxidoreductase subunit NuoE [Candidatus Dadabacteria bacterium]MCZ6556001.1 NADH-quinone oxidoreductase subunit NuoE [Candidatus Dadabacteria bacterium]MCZ6639703.1 NADH-quinone oxidoreductase subunit NuoE [Candidatus Dadabacteria bacterium]MCZ6684981.1 NADH-quinone oxidoreductase subunit NuoE [Candidatus Dadabacteria bacterium]MCZ6790903.1 NADH-quinone oxidoreductase subunit NuoE [Candidatus Dadabacteria bacterium]